MLFKTERLTAEKFNESMLHQLWLNSLDEDMQRFLPDEYFETEDDAREVMEYLIGCYDGGDGPFVYPLFITATNEQIGYVEACRIDKGWEVGYHIAMPYTKKGYASEALRAFLPWIMDKLGLNEIYGELLSDNVASAAVLEHCGFTLTFDGAGQYQGRERNIKVYVYKR